MGWQRHLLHAGTDAAPKMNPCTYALTGAACYLCQASPIDGIGLIFPRCSNGGTICVIRAKGASPLQSDARLRRHACP